ncbi:Multiple epidermal growth factor-like domains protein 6 [Labeo rohita]|uniref:Multiple epidermal growth factor-like domains protein 6 n=1 Tax=Labeo rohita TaxID=84645 RepID=A0ABQ8M0H3_LABRO|nr:Multiple epidermal growth factor-like domains protein 6 [Labeo rohita]
MFCSVALLLCCVIVALNGAASLDLQPDMPNVCEEQEVSMLGVRQPCVQAFTRMVKVWRQGCSSQRWCMGYERRTGYYTVYRQVYNMEMQTVYRCCPGWMQRGEERGCLHMESALRLVISFVSVRKGLREHAANTVVDMGFVIPHPLSTTCECRGSFPRQTSLCGSKSYNPMECPDSTYCLGIRQCIEEFKRS